MKNLSEIPPLNTQAILKSHGLKPDKKLGQNFLQDPLILGDITRAAEILDTDTVLEIGSGLGGLTRYLAAYYAGRNIRLHFSADVDTSVNTYWYTDEVSVYLCRIPPGGPITATPTALPGLLAAASYSTLSYLLPFVLGHQPPHVEEHPVLGRGAHVLGNELQLYTLFFELLS